MILTLNEIKERVKPVAEKHNVPVIYILVPMLEAKQKKQAILILL